MGIQAKYFKGFINPDTMIKENEKAQWTRAAVDATERKSYLVVFEVPIQLADSVCATMEYYLQQKIG